ncbi:universal stress protein [Nocardia sp. NPDC101769]|uniref:universal stress protein n=1 Tax=Nocardia sp. NPDC101769 TaxID=3364333 RepID=UPI00382B3D00
MRHTTGSNSSILVYVEDTATGLMAVDTAARIARETKSRLVLVYAYLPARPDRECDLLGPDAYLLRGGTPAESLVREFGVRVADSGAQLGLSMIRAGTPIRVLRDAVRNSDPVLTVVPDERSGLHPRWWGSFAGEVARRSARPVLAVAADGGCIVHPARPARSMTLSRLILRSRPHELRQSPDALGDLLRP